MIPQTFACIGGASLRAEPTAEPRRELVTFRYRREVRTAKVPELAEFALSRSEAVRLRNYLSAALRQPTPVGAVLERVREGRAA